MTRPVNFVDALLWSLCIVCAASLQTQVTLFASETYLGLRINLTDLIVPFAGIAILASLLRKSSQWPDWKIPHFYTWLVVLTAILAFALFNGWRLYGELSQWALINKFCGWLVLLGIMGLGAWIATNATRNQIETFLKIFLCIALVVLIHETTILVAQSFAWIQTWFPHNGYIVFPISGLMANRNSYAFLFLAVIAISTCFYFSKTPILKPTYSYIIFFLLPLFAIFNASRAGWILLFLLVTSCLYQNRHMKKQIAHLLVFLSLGAIVSAIFFIEKRSEVQFVDTHMLEVFQGEPETHYGDKMRTRILDMAFPMARENPILGSGLGSTMMEQERQTGKIINLIDNTALWLVVETGIIGTVLFCAFYLVIFERLFKNLKDDDEFSQTLRTSILYIVVLFTIMSLVHELMYTRFLWFFLGMGLALPAKTRQAV